MRTSDQLFQLIKSLSQTEKRYFRLQSQAMGSRDAKYLQLFDLLDKQKEYDEDKVLKKLGGGKKKLATDKNYLFEQIQKLLRPYYADNKVNNKVRAMIQDLQLLYDKGFISAAEKRYKQAIKQAKKYELLPEWQILLNWKWRSVLRLNIKDKKRIQRGVNDELMEVSRRQYVEAELRGLYDDMYYLMMANFNRSNFPESTIKEADELIAAARKFKVDKLPTYNAKKYWLLIYVWYHRLLGQREISIRYYEKIIHLADIHPHFIDYEPDMYCVSINNYLDLCMAMGKVRDFNKYLNKIKALPKRNFKFESDRFSMITQLSLNYYMNVGEVGECLKLYPTIKEGTEKYYELLPKGLLLNFIYIPMRASIHMGDLKDAIEKGRDLLKYSFEERLDIQQAAMLIHVACYYFVGDRQNAAYFYDSVKRHFAKLKGVNELEKISLKYLGKMMKLGDTQAKEAKVIAEEWFSAVLNLLQPTENKKRVYMGIDAIYVLVGHVATGRSYPELYSAYHEIIAAARDRNNVKAIAS